MHARPSAAGGTRASNSSLNDTATHQQGGSAALPMAIAHALPAPQSGQTPGDTGFAAAGKRRAAAHGKGASRATIRW